MSNHFLKDFSANQLFIWFMALSFLLVSVASAVIIYYRVSSSTIELQQQTSQQEMQHAEKALIRYLDERESALQDLANNSYIRNFAMGIGGSADRVRDVIKTYSQSVDFKVVIADVAGDTIYQDSSNLVTDHSLAQIITPAIDDSSQTFTKLCIKHSPTTLSITAPITHKGYIEGLIIAVIDINFNDPTSPLHNTDDRWISLSQEDRSTPQPKPIDAWLLMNTRIEKYGINYQYAIFSQDIDNQRSNLLIAVISTVITAMALAYLVIYILGRSLIVNPYSELSNSRTALKQAEREARQLASVAQYSNDGAVITDADGKTIWVNDAFTNITGYSLDDIQGRAPGSLLQGPDTCKETRARIRQAIENKQSVACEILNYTKQGQPYWLELQINPVFDKNNQLIRFVAIERDVSERQALEQQKEEMLEHAYKASVAKSQFLATMSHEIRTPMNGVLGIAQLLMKTDLDTYQREQLATLFESGNHMMSILNDILDFSKIEQGKLELEPIDFNLSELIESVTTVFQPICDEKGLTLSHAIEPEDIQTLNADKSRIRQVLYNLVGNAIKFTQVGRIQVTAKVTSEQSQTMLEICVADTGVGIPADSIAQLFDPFTQAELSTTRKYGGSGLGLSIVKKLSEVMGGNARIESELAKGTSVFASFCVEIAEASVQSDTEEHHASVDMSGKTALIVEDNAVNAMILQSFLEDTGFEVEIAEDGLLGLEAFKAGSYHAIFMDNHMPNMDGIACIEAIRAFEKDNQLAPTVIIGCTADAFAETRARMIDKGAQSVITKPVSEPALIDMIRRFLV